MALVYIRNIGNPDNMSSSNFSYITDIEWKNVGKRQMQLSPMLNRKRTKTVHISKDVSVTRTAKLITKLGFTSKD